MVGEIDDATPQPPVTHAEDDVETLQKVLADRLVALTALYAELKSKQLTLGIILICAAVAFICACIGGICWWDRQANEITETPYEERTRRFQAALGGDRCGSIEAARAAKDPFAERQQQLRRQVRILPADDDGSGDDSDGDGEPRLAGQSIGQGDSIAASASSTAVSSLRQRKRVHGISAAEQPTGENALAAAAVDPAGTAGTGRTDAAIKARSNPASPQGAGWLSWLSFGSVGTPSDEPVRSEMRGQYAERQAHLRQQIKILPADDSDD
jgi:hypothetical protein